MINLIMDGDMQGELSGKKIIEGSRPQFIRLKDGTVTGRSTVFIAMDLPDGSVAITEITMREFLMAARAMRAREEAEGLPE